MTAEPPFVVLSPDTPYRMADEWFDLARADHFWFEWRLRAVQRSVGPHDFQPPALEVGCGSGAARGQLEASYHVAVDGCDVNRAALERAAPGRGALFLYDVHDRRPAWREHFSTIALLDVLEHVAEPAAFLAAVAWHLRPGGRMVINVPALPWLYGRYDRHQGHVKRYTRRTLAAELHAAGLKLSQANYWGLSLVPVAIARNAWLGFCRPEQIMRRGFQPAGRVSDAILRCLMRVECGLGTRMPLGTSLLAVAGKEASR